MFYKIYYRYIVGIAFYIKYKVQHSLYIYCIIYYVIYIIHICIQCFSSLSLIQLIDCIRCHCENSFIPDVSTQILNGSNHPFPFVSFKSKLITFSKKNTVDNIKVVIKFYCFLIILFIFMFWSFCCLNLIDSVQVQ